VLSEAQQNLLAARVLQECSRSSPELNSNNVWHGQLPLRNFVFEVMQQELHVLDVASSNETS
jgi:hypothetical protein